MLANISQARNTLTHTRISASFISLSSYYLSLSLQRREQPRPYYYRPLAKLHLSTAQHTGQRVAVPLHPVQYSGTTNFEEAFPRRVSERSFESSILIRLIARQAHSCCDVGSRGEKVLWERNVVHYHEQVVGWGMGIATLFRFQYCGPTCQAAVS